MFRNKSSPAKLATAATSFGSQLLSSSVVPLTEIRAGGGGERRSCSTKGLSDVFVWEGGSGGGGAAAAAATTRLSISTSCRRV